MKLKVVTFNLRTMTDYDKEQNFIYRFDFIKDKINAEKPDIIGMQEMTWPMREYVVNGLKDYYIVGGGRDKDRFGEAVCIAFNKNRFVLNDCETFWLSDTPDVPGSLFPEDQSVYPRTCVSVFLTDDVSHESFRFYVVHTDHEGPIARLRAGEKLKEVIASRSGEPFIITGDFNAAPDTAEINVITNGDGVEIIDASDDFDQTFHKYGELKDLPDRSMKIDYIFHSTDFKCVSSEIWTDKRDHLFLSDHYPVVAILEK